MAFGTLLTVSIAMLNIIGSSYGIDIKVQPENPVYPTENIEFTATCIGKLPDPEKAPFLKFVDDNYIEIKNTSDNRITITSMKDDAKSETKLTIVWKMIKVNDVKYGIQCRYDAGGESHRFNIKVIPEASIPKIQIGPNSTISAVKGADYTFTCQASMIPVSPVKHMDLIWTFKTPTNEVLPANAKVDNSSTGANLTSTLTITNTENENVGIYYCVAVLTLVKKSTVKGKYYKFVDMIDVTYAGDVGKDVEEKVNAGDEVFLDCDAKGFPFPVLTWKKEDQVITANSSENYIFTDRSKAGPPNRFMKIANVDYSDRGVYECMAQYKTEKKVKKFTLRVRDPLGALWPVIGIIVEAIILVIVIYACEAYRKKKKAEKKAARSTSPSFKETSPLVSPSGPKVSYSGGDDGVRARITTTDNA